MITLVCVCARVREREREQRDTINRSVVFTYMASPVLAIWHRNCSSRGDGSFFPFLSKSVKMKNKIKNPEWLNMTI